MPRHGAQIFGKCTMSGHLGHLIACAKIIFLKHQTILREHKIIMIDPKMLEEFNSRMSAFMAASPAKDIEKNVKAGLAGLFANLDLVTREEFDIQAELLARALDRLKTLEARVEALESAKATA